MKRGVLAGLVAFLVVTAGCVGAMGAATPGGTDADVGDATDAESGTVNFYVSDRPNDILEVEVDDADSDDADETDDENDADEDGDDGAADRPGAGNGAGAASE